MRRSFTILFVFLALAVNSLKAQQYCTAGAYTCDEYISKVELNTISNSTGCGLTSQQYSDYTNISTTLQTGTNYTCTVTNGYYYSGDYMDIWVDWNNDKDFDDAGEYIGSDAANPAKITVKVPASPPTYGNVRMRIRCRYYGSANACGIQTYGEVEDYTITIPSPKPMLFDKLTASHPDTNTCFISQTVVPILKATATTYNGSYYPLSVDTIWFSTNGTTDPADILNVKLFRNFGTPLKLSDTLGSPILAPNGTFYFVMPQGSKLLYGDNNLWLGYDIHYKAKAGNYIDCQLLAARINDTIRYAGTAGNPVGRKMIVHPKDYTGYCDLTRSSGLNYLIGLVRVLFEGIDYQSGVYLGTGSCVDFYTGYIPTVYKQQTYQITMQHAPFNQRMAKLYIDWDNNGVWDNSELLATYNNVLPATVITDNITMPCTAVTGFHRIRIVIDGNGDSTTTCGTNSLGEAEDYLFYLAPEDTPKVSFTLFDPLNYVGGRTAFVPKSNIGGIIKYVWDFDNNGVWDDTTSGEAGFKYTSAGLKTVKVKGILEKCDNTSIVGPVFSDTFTVYTPPSKPIVNFISSANTVTTAIPVKFTDLTQYGPYKWKWTILPQKASNGNDAYTISSDTVKEPTVQFNEIGEYDVKLVATNILGSDSVMKTKYIVVVKENIICTDKNSNARNGYLYDQGGKYGNYPENQSTQVYETCGFLIKPKCAASVTADFLDFDVCIYNSTGCTQLTAGDNVRVYDGKDNNAPQLHLGPKDILGNPMFPDGFQNGPGNVERVIPSVTATSGVMYIEFNRNCGGVGRGFEIFWSTQTLNVTPPKAVIAGPTSNVYRLRTIKYGSLSTGVDLEYFWDLNGDGYNDSYDSAATWVYTTTGSYKVRLVVRSCDYFDTAYLNITVINPTVKPSVNFEADYVRVTREDAVNLINKSDLTIYSNEWFISPANFVYLDGTGMNSEDIKVRFTKTGKYTVKLKAYNAVGFDSAVKVDYITVYDNCVPGVANLSTDIGMSNVELYDIGENELISRSSSIGVTSYSDYSKTDFATLYATGKYTIDLTRNTSFNSITWTVFIDYNQDGQYDNSEIVAEAKNFNGDNWSTQFTIPSPNSKVFTGLTKMRVVANAGILANKGCGPNYTGEFEDYGIEIKLDNVKPYIILYGKDSSVVSSPDTTILNSCGTWVDPGYKGWDDVSGDITNKVIVTGVSGINPYQGGYYPLTYKVTDNSGNQSDIATRVVHVLPDIINPTITLKGNNPDSVKVFGSWTDPGYTPTDDCSGIKSHGSSGAVDVMHVGEYTITYTATDNANNVATVTRKVVVYDADAPTITLNGNDTLYLEVGTAFVDPGVTIVDNYYTNLTASVKGSVNEMLLGTYFLTYCVTDSSGNGPVCVDRIVIVRDTEAPKISFKNSLIEVDVFKPFTVPEPDKSDNYWPADKIIVTQTGNVNTFVLGDYVLTFKATDASGNQSAPVQITVRVVDRVAPSIEMNGSTMMVVGRWSDFKDPGVVVKDNYYPKDQLTMQPNTGTFINTLQTGLFNITYQVCDPSNNCSDVLSRFVLVIEDEHSISIDEMLSEKNFRVFPNPASDQVNIQLSLPAYIRASISIYNTLGEKVMEVADGIMMNETYQVGVDHLSDGIYYVRLNIGNEQFNYKFVIVR